MEDEGYKRKFARIVLEEYSWNSRLGFSPASSCRQIRYASDNNHFHTNKTSGSGFAFLRLCERNGQIERASLSKLTLHPNASAVSLSD